MSDDLSRLHRFDDLTARIWRDKRCTPGTRELLLAMAWVIARDPDYSDPGMSGVERGRYLWRQLGVMLGHERRQPRYKQLVAEDAPRYVPPNTWPNRQCEAPRTRAYRPRASDGPGIVSSACLIARHPHSGVCRYAVVPGVASVAVKPAAGPADPFEICGANPKLDYHLVERNPITGWCIEHWFCARHRDQFERVKTQLENAPEASEPMPNVGGLLPCYFRADWGRVYAWARPGWTVPVYGIAADDWAGVSAGAVRPRRPGPGLRVILGELADV